MKIAPLSVGTIHLIGIGGIGISGIAEILHSMGYKVQGSDQVENSNTERLRKDGIPVFIGHKAENVKGVNAVVHSTAIHFDNPEIIQARKEGIPVMHRSEMMAEIMRFKSSICISGSHGKTTTTSLIGSILKAAHLKPTIINGGIINSLKTNAIIGTGDWMVVEADESDSTFIKIPSTISVITNIDPEHLDHYKTFEILKESFLSFAKQVPFYGFALLCTDHPVVNSLTPHITNRRFISYGVKQKADCMGHNVKATPEGMVFDVTYKNHHLKGVHLNLHGDHNVLNALAAIAIAFEFKVDDQTIHESLSSFQGVKRRFTKVGEWNGVSIIDDYAHHPSEIKAVLSAAKGVAAKKIIVVMQPHRYSRLHNLFEDFSTCFQGVDHLILAPVYAAGESAVPGADHIALAKAVALHLKFPVDIIQSPGEIPEKIKAIAHPGDYVIFMGAGSITQWAYALEDDLKKLD
ncbi:MAG: UDP-N-acetylmuramate--L-alanine ligase [Alphaproteobacteria bacterium]